MAEPDEVPAAVSVMPAPAPVISGWAAYRSNLWQGCRMACFLTPHADALRFSWGQLLALLLTSLLLGFAFQFAYVGLDGVFQPEVMPEYVFIVPELMLAWCMARIGRDSAGAARCLIALLSMGPPVIAASPLIAVAYPLVQTASTWVLWLLNYSLLLWYAAAVALAAVRLFDMHGVRAWGAAIFAFAFLTAADSAFHSERWLWAPPSAPDVTAAHDSAEYALNDEDNFYRQPQLLASALASLRPERPGRVDLYFIGAAGDASQDVFMREVNSVAQLFEQRFDTRGRSIRLINNPATVADLPIFSRTSLRQALNHVGGLMNRDEDILFLFMTSHGSSDHKFALDFGSIRFNEVDPGVLRKLLDESGIKHRVVVVSACYSGGFVDALKNDNTLVLTAAAANRNSFGCDNENDFTYFGKAYFNEALRKTYSFVDAFNMAKPVIAEREAQEKYTPSEPQIYIGKDIAPVLDAFAKARQQAVAPEAQISP